MENIVATQTNVQNKSVVSKEKMQDSLLDQPISVIMTQNLWVRQFMHECCALFGMPCVKEQCMTKEDRFKYAFSLMSVSTGMRRFGGIWKPMHERIDPKDAAWEFCRRFYEKTGNMLIPNSSEEIAEAARLIPKLMTKKGVQGDKT